MSTKSLATSRPEWYTSTGKRNNRKFPITSVVSNVSLGPSPLTITSIYALPLTASLHQKSNLTDLRRYTPTSHWDVVRNGQMKRFKHWSIVEYFSYQFPEVLHLVLIGFIATNNQRYYHTHEDGKIEWAPEASGSACWRRPANESCELRPTKLDSLCIYISCDFRVLAVLCHEVGVIK